MNVQIKRRYFVHRRHLIVLSKGNPTIKILYYLALWKRIKFGRAIYFCYGDENH